MKLRINIVKTDRQTDRQKERERECVCAILGKGHVLKVKDKCFRCRGRISPTAPGIVEQESL